MNIDEYYDNHYEEVVNSGLVGKFSDHYHFLMERDFTSKKFDNILELGAGKGQHLHFVKCDYEKYIQTDIRLNKSTPSVKTLKSSWAEVDAQNLWQFKDGEFDRTIATCLLAHLHDPERALSEWRRVTSLQGGFISIYIPCEPSFLLRLAQNLSTRRKATKIGMNYSSVHYREHRNHYFFLRSLIIDIFKYDKIKVIGFPSKFMPFDFKLYEIYQIELANKEEICDAD